MHGAVIATSGLERFGQAVAAPSAYREFHPRRELAGLIACTWEREVAADGTPGATSRVLPDGCVDLVWKDARLFVAGPDTQAVSHRLEAGSSLVGLRLRPGVAGSVLGLPASELRDQRPPVEAIWGRAANGLVEGLGTAADAARRRSLLEDAIASRLPEIVAPDPLVAGAVVRLGLPGSRVGDLSDTLFVSERHLRRVFREAVGYGPKMLDRVLRFQRFLSLGRAIAAGEDDLAAVAAELGYADQAHLTRECGRISGLTPGRLVEIWTG